ncbi:MULTISPECIES: hypothetical protein [Mycobacterium]|uniref:hypothetical protein n=1 Tax=Mycobacterium TaxID=1763 RepID=UPI0002ACE09E|nr:MULTISPECIES: hypothetical protein [Mycobacterium]ELR85684.1 hypothetical protein W7U_10710 [Mycobacterium sp. H4Y]
MTDFTTEPNYDVLDAPREHGNTGLGRCIVDSFGHVEPYLEEADGWVSLPLRLVVDQAAGMHLECGPYDFDRADIDRLREAVNAYDTATQRDRNPQ